MFQISRYPKRWTALAVLSLLALALGLAGCGGAAPEPEAKTEAPAEVWPPALPGYAAMTVPADNPMTEDKVELGKMLYYDKRVSFDYMLRLFGPLSVKTLALDDEAANRIDRNGRLG